MIDHTEPTTEAERSASRLAQSVLDRATIDAITDCVQAGHFQSRDFGSIIRMTIDRAGHIEAVLAAFGFLRRASFTPNITPAYVDLIHPDGIAELSEDVRTQAGLCLFRASVGWNGPIPGVVLPLPPSRRPEHQSIITLKEHLTRPISGRMEHHEPHEASEEIGDPRQA